jgi:hypothetical protein
MCGDKPCIKIKTNVSQGNIEIGRLIWFEMEIVKMVMVVVLVLVIFCMDVYQLWFVGRNLFFQHFLI